MKFVDIGKKSSPGVEVALSSPKNEKYYPSIYLEVAPDELWNKEIGEECQIECVVIVKSKSASERENGKEKTLTLEVLKIAYDGDEDDEDGKEMKRQFKAMKGIEDEEEEDDDAEND